MLTKLFYILFPEDTYGLLIRLFISIVLFIVSMYLYMKIFKEV
jgi:hypothetical protein